LLQIILKRIKWILFGRNKIATKALGFSAHWAAFTDAQSKFGEYVRLGKNTRISKSSLGKCTYVAGAEIRNADVGSFCSIGREVLVGGLGKHPVQWLSTHPAFYSPLMQSGVTFVTESKFDELVRTEIGNDVWIGARAIVLDGVRIGDGAIVAAGAVVAKDVAPYSIVGGVPAKEIRKRFDEKKIDLLLTWKWWELPLAVLEELAPSFIEHSSWGIKDIQLLQAKSDELLEGMEAQ